jgi:hypothetical protein
MSKRRKTTRKSPLINRRRKPHLEILENRRLLTASSESPNVAISSINQYGTVLFGQDWQDDLGINAAQIQQHIQADTWRSALNDSPAATISQIRQEAQYLGAETLQAQIDSALEAADLPTIDIREFDWLQERSVGPAALADYFADGEVLDEMLAEGEGGTERKFYIKFQEYETYEGHLINAGQDSTLTIHIGYTGDYVEGGFSVNWNATNGTASAGSDFTPASGTVNFTDTAEGEQPVNLTIINDTLDELDETFTVQVGSPDGARGSTEVTIWENDLHVAIFDADPVTEGDVYTPWVSQMPKSRFRVTISSPRDFPVSIPYKVLNGNPNDPPAFRGPDFYYWQSNNPEIDDSITFEPNETEKFIEIPIVSDYLHEPNEYFYVEIANQWLFQLAYIVDDGHARGSIVDDDPIIDLDAALVLHNQSNGWLDDEEEEDIGAFLPVNDDDDDYDLGNLRDFLQSGPIANETDLLEIRLSKFKTDVQGFYSLSIPSHIRLWLSPDRTAEDEVTAANSFDSTVDWTFYAEAITASSGTLSAWWSTVGLLTPMLGDEVKLTSFHMHGPLNVPGHTIYEYTVWNPPLPTSHWVSSNNGIVTTSSIGEEDGFPFSKADIKWGGEKAIGLARFQVNPNYVWDREVNVVQIDISVDVTDSKLDLIEPTEANKPFHTEFLPYSTISSAPAQTDPGKSAMNATFEVVRVEGPTRGSSPVLRGIKFMQMGLIQNLDVDKMRGIFGNRTPILARVSNMENAGVLLDADPTSPPWYLPVNAMTTSLGGYLYPSTDQLILNKKLVISDRPRNQAVSDMPIYEDSAITNSELKLDFFVYFAVRTTDVSNLQHEIYTQRAVARWYVDASGTYTGANANTYGTWTGDNARVRSDEANERIASFVQVVSGARVPKTTGPTANEVGATDEFFSIVPD